MMQYGQATTIYVFAFGSPAHATLAGLPIAGDAANITCQISKDGAALAALTDVTATEIGGGYYAFDVSATEAQYTTALFVPASATADVQVVRVDAATTTPANFNAAVIDVAGTIGRVALVDTTTANTDMRGTDGALTSSADVLTAVDAVNANVLTALADTASIISTLGAILVDTDELQQAIANGGRTDLLIDSIKAKTDQLTFSVAGVINANALRANGAIIYGTGAALDKWRGVA